MLNRTTEIVKSASSFSSRNRLVSWIKENKFPAFLAGSAAVHTAAFLTIASDTAFSLVARYGAPAIVPSFVLLVLGKMIVEKLREKPAMLPLVEAQLRNELNKTQAELNKTAREALDQLDKTKQSQINWGHFLPMAERVAVLGKSRTLPLFDLNGEQAKWETRLGEVQRQVETKMAAAADGPLEKFTAALKYLDGTGSYRFWQSHLFKALEKGTLNCEASAKLSLAVLQRAYGSERNGWQLAVAKYSDHLEVVLFNKERSVAYHPKWGRTPFVPTSVYDPHLFAAAYLDGQRGEATVSSDALLLKRGEGKPSKVLWLETVFNRLNSRFQKQLFVYSSYHLDKSFGVGIGQIILASIPGFDRANRLFVSIPRTIRMIILAVAAVSGVAGYLTQKDKVVDQSAEVGRVDDYERRKAEDETWRRAKEEVKAKEAERQTAVTAAKKKVRDRMQNRLDNFAAKEMYLSRRELANEIVRAFEEKAEIDRHGYDILYGKNPREYMVIGKNSFNAALAALSSPEGTAVIGENYFLVAKELKQLKELSSPGGYTPEGWQNYLQDRERYIQAMITKYKEDKCSTGCPTMAHNILLQQLLKAKRITLKPRDEVQPETTEQASFRVGQSVEPGSLVEIDIVNLPALEKNGLGRPEPTNNGAEIEVDAAYFMSVLMTEQEVAISLLNRLSAEDLGLIKERFTAAIMSKAVSRFLLSYNLARVDLNPRVRAIINGARGIKRQMMLLFLYAGVVAATDWPGYEYKNNAWVNNGESGWKDELADFLHDPLVVEAAPLYWQNVKKNRNSR